MWDIGNRGIIVLISVLSGCVLLYNLWGPFVALTTALILVTYACYSLLVNDSILSPHALLAFEYLIEVARELNENLKNAARHILKNLREYSKNIKTLYQSRIISKMSSQRRSTYQLSNDSSSEPKNSRFNLTGQLSPIPRMNYCDMDNGIENNFYVNTHNRSYAESSVNKHTSTPLVSWRKDSPRNGGVGFFTPSRSSRQKNLPIQSHNHTLFRGEDTVFSPNGSPWGTSISPKMEQNTNVVKTVQTVAGPLLASTRFNIDPKIYSDVTSPGLSTRLTKYAMEANSKLAHQSQYGPGQFPKVNLNSSPVPLINTKSPKHKTPVTVRIAPPDATKYSPPERQKILSDAYHVESKPSPSVVQVLRDISLKRHASREDISDLIKKQRTESMFKDNLENLEELTQKRTRDDSSKSEDDVSPQNKSLRPSKRTKTPSCYDVLNSLSSSIHTSSGVKRKAMDISRSGTPDFEKHFKPSETVQKSTVPILPQIQTNTAKLQNRDYIHKCLPSTDIINSHKNLQEQQQTQGVLKGSCGREIAANQGLQTVVQTHSGTSDVEKAEAITRKNAEQVNKPVSLTDKLFMRPEPEKNEKLKSLIQEQGHIKAKFTSEDAEEIKKEDIMNMRQTSMRARLQSMFDAISGKAANKINPDVVIQAEEINTTTTTVATSALTTTTTSTPSAAHAPTPAVLASLNSSTSTTNVNTSPIATSAIAPAVLKSQPKSVKHVTFSLPSTEFSQGSVNPPTVVAPPVAMLEKPLTKLEESKLQTTAAATAPAPIHTTSSAILNFTASTGNTTGPSFNFNAASSSTTPASSNAASKFGASSATYINSLASTAISSATVSSSVFGSSNIAPGPTVIPSSSVSTTINSREASTAGNTIQLPTVTNTSQATPMFDYGAKTMSNVMKTNSQHKTPISTNTILFGGASNAGSSVSSFGSITTTTQNPPAFGSNSTTAQSAPAFGTASSTPQNARPFENTFTHPSSTPAFGNTSITESVPTCKSTPANTQSASTFVSTSVTSGFAFPSSSTAPPTAVPSFGNTANTTSSGFGISTTTASFTFGQPSATTTTHSGFSFGTGTTSTAAPSSSTSAIFGSATTNATPAFRMPPTTSSPSFGIIPATPALGSATSSSLFGTGNTQPAYASTSNAFSTLKTTALPAFGSTTSAPTFGTAATTATSPFSAGNTNSNTNSNVTTTPTPSFSSSTGIFGQIKSPSAFGAPTPVFGNTTSPPFNSRLPFIAAFGATSSTTTTVPPTFGTTNSTASAFGVQSPGTSALGSQTSTTLPFGSTNSVFGTSTATPPAFGTNINTTAAFGQTTSTAFGTQNTTSPVFGTTNNNVPGFGGNVASPFGSQTTTSAFGNSTSSTPTFGAAANTNSASGAFSFGGNQNPPQQNSSFSFGGPSTTSNSASGSAPFQFGAANTKPAGFNFNSASSTPVTNFDASATPSFSAPTPGANAFSTPNTGGMFNIGAGSTAPRSRSSRQRRQR